MEEHVAERLDRAVEKWGGRSDSLATQEIRKAHDKYRLDDLLRKGAACSAHIVVATHVAKATHPDLRARQVTNPNIDPGCLAGRAEIGSHVLTDVGSIADTTGDGAHNAAAYELYLLLERMFEGRTLGAWLQDRDKDAVRAFAGDDPPDDDAVALAMTYAALLSDKTPQPATDTRAKQLYWLVGDDPLAPSHYHLLAPLYASALAQAVHHRINDDRFSEAGKQARQARRDGEEHPTGFREYVDLAVQKFGGTKPQNISHLNSERRGTSYLLSSLPPRWRGRALVAPLHVESAFPRFGQREGVRSTVAGLLRFLFTDPVQNRHTRNTVDRHVDGLIDELVLFAVELQSGLPPGWSADPDCRLLQAQALWLDPHRCESDEAFRSDWQRMEWPDQIGRAFANWLNAQLEGRLPVGENEARQWRRELLIDESVEGWAAQLHRQRRQQDAPTYIPVRGAAP